MSWGEPLSEFIRGLYWVVGVLVALVLGLVGTVIFLVVKYV